MVTEDLALRKVPPQSFEAEQAVLGAILLDPQALYKTTEALLDPQDFYRPAHRDIFLAMRALAENNDAVDLITLTDALRARGTLAAVGGAGYLAELLNTVVTAAHVRSHAQIIHQKAILRYLISVSTDIVERCYEETGDPASLLDAAEKQIFEIANRTIRSGFVPMKPIVQAAFDIIEKLSDKTITGLPTGFLDLDAMTAGLQPSDLVIVAGRPSMGKTAFAMGLATHVAIHQKKTVGVFSLEMSKEQLVFRMLCSEARVDANKVRTGYIGRPGNETWMALIRAAELLHNAPVFIDDSTMVSIYEMRAKARRLKATAPPQAPLGLVIVDYLQLMQGREGEESRERVIAEISRSLKGLAKELQVPVVALSQMNRGVEARDKKRPILADLRESGAIEQDADLVLFIHRQEVYQPCTCPDMMECSCGRRGIAEIIIGKQRNGPIGTVKLAFINKYTCFENLDRAHPALHATME